MLGFRIYFFIIPLLKMNALRSPHELLVDRTKMNLKRAYIPIPTSQPSRKSSKSTKSSPVFIAFVAAVIVVCFLLWQEPPIVQKPNRLGFVKSEVSVEKVAVAGVGVFTGVMMLGASGF